MDEWAEQLTSATGSLEANVPTATETQGECECGRCREPSPDVIIDGRGHEVAVVVGYAQYISLLGILATQLDHCLLPPYWRAAVERCLLTGSTRAAYAEWTAPQGSKAAESG